MLEKAGLLGLNEHFESERNIAFKRGQRVFAHFAERSNEKEHNDKATLSGGFYLIFAKPPRAYPSVVEYSSQQLKR